MAGKMKIRFIISLFVFLSVAIHTEAQRVALKSNLLSAVNGTLNGGVEYVLGMRSTLELSGGLRPWKRSEEYVNRYWLVQPEYRYWMCRKFNGSFLGAYMNGGEFNIGGKKAPFGLFKDLRKHRYSGWLAGAGVCYGYQFMLHTHWNIEASVGVGYEYIDYVKYKCPAVCADVMDKGHYHYFGPNKAAVSLIYIF